MRDRRPVDELSIEELERILLIKKREARMARFRGGEAIQPAPMSAPPAPVPLPAPVLTVPPPVVVDAVPDDGGIPQFEDDLPPVQVDPRRVVYADDEGPGAWQRAAGSLFLLVELGAIVGLGAVLFLAYQGLTRVNQNIERTSQINATSEAQLAAQMVQPTETPIITVNRVVLPGGHIWDANGQHRFNLNEVPEPYRAAFQQQLEAPRTEFLPPVEGGPIRVQIPAIGVDATVRAGDDWITLQAGVGHYPNSGRPGQRGNMVLTAHNDIFGEIFRRIEELQPGDEVRVQSTSGQWYTYIVREKQAVDPTEVWVLDQNLGQESPLVTLITCYPYRVNTKRMVVFAELVSPT